MSFQIDDHRSLSQIDAGRDAYSRDSNTDIQIQERHNTPNKKIQSILKAQHKNTNQQAEIPWPLKEERKLQKRKCHKCWNEKIVIVISHLPLLVPSIPYSIQSVQKF